MGIIGCAMWKKNSKLVKDASLWKNSWYEKWNKRAEKIDVCEYSTE